ncbi:MAG: DUF6232 family protein [Cyanobacteria bacterium P01_H01_bin.26]
MEPLSEQQQNHLSAIDNLALDTAALPSQFYSKPSSNSYTVETFQDEASISSTEISYGKHRYLLGDIDSLQILKLHGKRSVIQKKLSDFLAGVLTVLGLVLLISSLSWSTGLLGTMLIAVSIGYVIYFNRWFSQRRQDEFGLVITTKSDAKIVITSPNLRAVQTLYQVIFRRIEFTQVAHKSMVVNMYTGAIVADRKDL